MDSGKYIIATVMITDRKEGEETLAGGILHPWKQVLNLTRSENNLGGANSLKVNLRQFIVFKRERCMNGINH